MIDEVIEPAMTPEESEAIRDAIEKHPANAANQLVGAAAAALVMAKRSEVPDVKVIKQLERIQALAISLVGSIGAHARGITQQQFEDSPETFRGQ